MPRQLKGLTTRWHAGVVYILAAPSDLPWSRTLHHNLEARGLLLREMNIDEDFDSLQSDASVLAKHKCLMNFLVVISVDFCTNSKCISVLDRVSNILTEAGPDSAWLLPVQRDDFPLPERIRTLRAIDARNRSADEATDPIFAALSQFVDDSWSRLHVTTNAELVRRIGRERDHDAFAVLYERVLPEVIRVCRTRGIADGAAISGIIHDVMLAIWNQPPAITNERAKDDFANFVAYLTLKFCRSLLGTSEGATFTSGGTPWVEANPDEFTASAASDTSQAELAKAVDALDSNEKQIVRLYYTEGKTIRDIAKLLGMRQEQIFLLHHKIMKKLSANLAETKGRWRRDQGMGRHG